MSTQILVFCFLGLVLALGAMYFGVGLFKHMQTLKYSVDKKDLFMADLFKLQTKWSLKGRPEYSAGISMLISSFNTEVENPQTEEGKAILKAFKNVDQE